MDNGSPTDGRALRTRPSATGPNRSDGMKSVVELRLWALSGTDLTAHETTGAPRPGREDMTKEECLVPAHAATDDTMWTRKAAARHDDEP